MPRNGSPLSKRKIQGPAGRRKPRAFEGATVNATGTGDPGFPFTARITFPR